MASTDMFAAMSAWTPSYDSDVTVNVRYPGGVGVNNLRNEFSESDCPMRMIGLPEVPGAVQDWGFIRLGTGGSNTYRIVDRLYLNPTVMQLGLEYSSIWLWRYQDSYTTAMRAGKAITDCATIRSVEYQHGWREWNNISYYTIDCIVTIEEFLL